MPRVDGLEFETDLAIGAGTVVQSSGTSGGKALLQSVIRIGMGSDPNSTAETAVPAGDAMTSIGVCVTASGWLMSE